MTSCGTIGSSLIILEGHNYRLTETLPTVRLSSHGSHVSRKLLDRRLDSRWCCRQKPSTWYVTYRSTFFPWQPYEQETLKSAAWLWMVLGMKTFDLGTKTTYNVTERLPNSCKGPNCLLPENGGCGGYRWRFHQFLMPNNLSGCWLFWWRKSK